MRKIAKSITELIGHTPLLELSNYNKRCGVGANIVAKLEYFNPGGSVKDRAALSMINGAEERGELTSGATIIEPTSGNTGVGLALVSAARGYRLILTMPETMSIERRRLLKALGAEVVLTAGAMGMKGVIAEANRLRDEMEGAVILQQFDNSDNPLAHRLTTANEIWNDTNGEIDIFVSGVGTGGTVSGVGGRLKELNPSIKVVAVEPLNSPVLSGGTAGAHKIQGIGAGFIPANYNADVVDEIIPVESDAAMACSREVARCEGVLVGISSGAALYAATLLAQRKEHAGKRIVVLLPDTGERYLSTPLFEAE